jgi:hypothetical protein
MPMTGRLTNRGNPGAPQVRPSPKRNPAIARTKPRIARRLVFRGRVDSGEDSAGFMGGVFWIAWKIAKIAGGANRK